MRLSIGVFERREHATTRWTTLGLGEATRKAEGLHVFKVRERIEDDVRKLIEGSPAHEVARFRFVPGARLGAGAALRASEARLRVVVAVFLALTSVVYAVGELSAIIGP